MAESGEKVFDVSCSLSLGSEEDFEHVCAPCSSEGQRLEAFRYCVECQEYLCKNCIGFHKKTKVLKHHSLIEKENKEEGGVSSNNTAEPCTEKCSSHADGIVKFFCPKHFALGCTDCMIMGHRTCKIEYIPEICVGIRESEEFSDTVKLLDKKLKHLDDVVKRAEGKDREVEVNHGNVMEEISKFREEIDNHMNFLQRRSETNALNLKTEAQREIKRLCDACIVFSSDLKQLEYCLKGNQASQQNSQIFCALKRAQAKLQSNKMENIDKVLERKNCYYKFEGSTDIKSVLAEQEFGKIQKKNPLEIAKNINETVEDNTLDFGPNDEELSESSWNFIEKGEINVTRETDMSKCTITGCDVMSSGEIVLVDYINYRLKIVTIETAFVTEDRELYKRPWDVTVLPRDQIAVTLPSVCTVVILSRSLEIEDGFKVKGHCYGICYHDDPLFIVCQNPKNITITGVKGVIKFVIPLKDDKLFCNPTYVEVGNDHKLLYISDCDSNSMAAITLSGQLTAMYSNKDFRGPLGMVTLNDGSFLVCSKSNNTIQQISGDLKEKMKVIRIKNLPQSICYSAERNEVYIGRWRDDVMTVLGFEG